MKAGVPNLLSLLACPACRESLSRSGPALACEGCGRLFEIAGGIPILLAEESDDALKLRQARHFDDEQADELEIERPHGTPRLYEWQYLEKFRRSVSRLGALLPRATALTVCGGSGMDAEFLARAGCVVISSDISLGAARRAQERARRYGLPITPVVADAERLPFADRAVDLVSVHDGLHHLERPLVGLAEMTRVAGRAVSVTEPARAAVTALAVRLGLALEVEEAGNRVARLTLDELTTGLRKSGFQVLEAERFAMYFRHRPGRVIAALSSPVLFPLMTLGFRAANGVAGPLGNKLTVQAVRVRDRAPVRARAPSRVPERSRA